MILLLFYLTFRPGECIEDYELDLYDLVEEVNGTFYEFMGLDEVCLYRNISPSPISYLFIHSFYQPRNNILTNVYILCCFHSVLLILR